MMKKRIFLLAGHDKNNTIQDYVVYLAGELAKLGDVFYCADTALSIDEREKLAPFVKQSFATPHTGGSFGSWQMLIRQLGWKKLTTYDEMIICNDEVYGPMTNLADIFDYMTLRDYDFWSMTENKNIRYHLDTYFMVFGKSVIQNTKFQEFWENITPNDNPKIYESVLTPFLLEQGFIGNGYIKNYTGEDQMAHPLHMLKSAGMPFVRVRSLQDPEHALREPSLFLDKRLERSSGYDSGLIRRHLSADPDHTISFGPWPR